MKNGMNVRSNVQAGAGWCGYYREKHNSPAMIQCDFASSADAWNWINTSTSGLRNGPQQSSVYYSS